LAGVLQPPIAHRPSADRKVKPFKPKEGSTMLVLSRKKNESIVINNDITIVVVEIRGDKVRLGVEAPREVPVHRREVYDAIQRSHQADDSSTATQE
jgi:carbon storage regulator